MGGVTSEAEDRVEAFSLPPTPNSPVDRSRSTEGIR